MRGTDEATGALFSYVDLEDRIPAQHPLRKVRAIVNDALASMDTDLDRLYAREGRPSIAPERLLRASLVQILFSVRSERQLMEQMQYNLLFRWFVGLGIDDPVWGEGRPEICPGGQISALNGRSPGTKSDGVLEEPRPPVDHRHRTQVPGRDPGSRTGRAASVGRALLGRRHADQGLGVHEELPAKRRRHAAGGGRRARRPTFRTLRRYDRPVPSRDRPVPSRDRPDDPPDPQRVDFRGEKRSNKTHTSTTDPDARLFKKSPGAGAMLCFMGHTLMENRNGLVVQADLTQADGRAERRAAIDMIDRHSPGSTRRLTLGADKGFDSADFVADLRRMCVTPHVARKARHSAIDGRTTRHAGYAASQKRRKKIEEPFGWAKTVGGMAQTTLRGVERVRARFTLTMAACNLARLPRLLAA